MRGRKRNRVVKITGAILAALALPMTAVVAMATESAGKTAVSLSPHLTELVYAAGAGSHLLGVSDGSNFPPEAASLPRLGSGVTPNVERIALLHPQVILAWGYKNSEGLYPALQKLNIPVLYQAPGKLEDIIRDIEALGELFGTQHIAQATARELEAILASTRKRYRDATSVNTFILVGRQPLYTLGNNSFVMDALHACGAVSSFEALSAPAPVVSREQLLLARPQVVLFAAKAKTLPAEAQAIRRDFSALGLSLQADQLIGQDPDVLFRPSDRLIRSLPALCEAIDQVRRRLSPAVSELPSLPPPHRP